MRSFGKDFDSRDRRVVRFAVRHSLANPSNQQFVIVGIGLQAFAASVRHGAGRFEQEETAIRRRREQSASASFLDQMFVIFRRFETEQRKPEAILAARFAVTAPGVAARLREDWHDLIREINRRDLSGLLHRDGRRGQQTVFALRRNRCCAIRNRCGSTGLVDLNDAGRRRLVADLPGEIANFAGIEFGGNQQLLPGIGSAQM